MATSKQSDLHTIAAIDSFLRAPLVFRGEFVNRSRLAELQKDFKNRGAPILLPD